VGVSDMFVHTRAHTYTHTHTLKTNFIFQRLMKQKIRWTLYYAENFENCLGGARAF
jgi:hypothetical protein